ncbi:MAG TPA: YciI family protein [Ferruginibacter sp.]|nr:YciI family protein [Ferruginibacter sp.]
MKQVMNISILMIVFTIFSVKAFAQTDKATTPAEKIVQYWFVMIKTGPKQDFDSVAKAKLFAGHMENINRLYYDGILKVAGPFGKNDLKWRGIFILDCATKEEAEKYVMTDPAVAAGLFAVDIVPWYGEPSGSFKKGKPEKPN